MRTQFDEQLKKLNTELIEMGSLIERSIQNAVNALVQQNVECAKRAISYDAEVDQKEKEIEHLCLKLLLQQQPVAKDLRFLSAALKMITDMERIGDQAADISEIAILLSKFSHVANLEKIQKMADETIRMVTTSIDAFVNRDLTLARAVIMKDDIVDALFVEVKADVITLIQTDVANSEQATDWLMVAKYFERIGDHATNIAEWVIFSITGKHDEEEEN